MSNTDLKLIFVKMRSWHTVTIRVISTIKDMISKVTCVEIGLKNILYLNQVLH